MEKLASTKNLTLEKIYELLAKCVADNETSLDSAINKLEKEGDIGQAELLAIQSKIQSWGNLGATATGLLRAIGDSLKATTQNIR